MNPLYTAMQEALRQSPPARDPQVTACLSGLRLFSAAARERRFQEPRLLLLFCRIAYRLLELDYQRLESYLGLIWLCALLREYTRARQLIRHAEKVCGPHPALQAAEACIETLLRKPVLLMPDLEARQIHFTTPGTEPPPVSTAPAEAETEILSWPALQSLLQKQLEKLSQEQLQQRWTALDYSYRFLQEQVLKAWQGGERE